MSQPVFLVLDGDRWVFARMSDDSQVSGAEAAELQAELAGVIPDGCTVGTVALPDDRTPEEVAHDEALWQAWLESTREARVLQDLRRRSRADQLAAHVARMDEQIWAEFRERMHQAWAEFRERQAHGVGE